jgi:UDP-N-acetylmuramoyl-L-alanyl-D-glutamate--2,6-diaminopimelate ligase
MTFQQVLDGAEVLSRAGDAEVRGVQYDSRRVRPGEVFVAIKGETTDGNRYVDAAIKAGATAVVTDSLQESPRPGVAWAVVPHGRRALARVSANFLMRPAEKLAITGITGTNGKTTTSFLVESILDAAGRKSALIGTIEYHISGRAIEAPHTTPEALDLHSMFADALRQGATEAVMEVSSHALAQERVFAVPFNVAVFTNLTRDHLDYHGTFDQYFDAKRVLFNGCGTEPATHAVTNIDDEYGRELAKFSKGKSQVLIYGLERGDFHAEKVDIGQNGTRFDLVTPEGRLPIWSPLIGRVNVYNIMAAAAAGYARQCPGKAIVDGVAALRSVPGRFEKVDSGQPFTVVVDYAHTDDALRNLTALAREFVARGKGRVITVFGCGGDRDRAKRPLMGEAAGRGSDFVVLTSDNPRSEDPVAIINDALPGLQRTGTRYVLESDRRKAIALAIDQTRAGDIVLIAGKGHEKKQITREGVTPFDDVEVAEKILAEAGYQHSAAHNAEVRR